jgi:hypothetical protein
VEISQNVVTFSEYMNFTVGILGEICANYCQLHTIMACHVNGIALKFEVTQPALKLFCRA